MDLYKHTACPECLELDPDTNSRNEGIGGTVYGSKYSWDDDWVFFTDCCESSTILKIDDSSIELSVILRFLKRFGDVGVISEFVKEIEIESGELV